MHPSKAPGPDGFPTLFYQRFWSEVGETTILNCLEIINQSRSVADWNHTYIALIAKLNTPKKVSDYKPISLCNVAYKIIANVLVNRMKGVLLVVISENQFAFVLGRSIFYNIIVGHECLHTIKSRHTGRKGWLALKFDMSKAYDRVEWCFLERWMLKIGFHSKWVALIMDCVKSATFFVLLNGVPTGNIIPQRGLRQGDPLSPYLFLLCSKAFSSMINGAMTRKQQTGMKANKHCPDVSHIFFADDSLIFFQASIE